jgi:hypothetical protein
MLVLFKCGDVVCVDVSHSGEDNLGPVGGSPARHRTLEHGTTDSPGNKNRCMAFVWDTCHLTEAKI